MTMNSTNKTQTSTAKFEEFFSTSYKDDVFEILEKFPNVGAEFFNGLDIYLIRGNQGTKQHSEYEHFKFKELPENFTSIPWEKVLFAFDDFETVTKLEEYVKKSGGKIIANKGATFYAIADSVVNICGILLAANESIWANGSFTS
mgnify:CR=1 FL=1